MKVKQKHGNKVPALCKSLQNWGSMTTIGLSASGFWKQFMRSSAKGTVVNCVPLRLTAKQMRTSEAA